MIGHLRDAWLWYHNPYRFLDQALQERGLTFTLRLPVLGQALVTGERALIQEIMGSKSFIGGRGIAILRAILGEQSMITLTGPEHRERRRLIYPFFHGPATHHYDALITGLTQAALDRLPPGQPFSVYELVRTITLKSIIQVIFGPLSVAEAAEAEQLVERFLSSFNNALILFLKPLHLDLGEWSPWGRMMRRRDRLLAFIFDQIDRCGQNNQPGLLAHIVARAPDLSREALAAEILALLLFGHDTGAATLAWACAHIYQEPELVAQLRREASSAAEPEAMPLLAACLNESMRLCPAIVHPTRVAATETRLGSYTLPAGQVVIPCTYLAQHNPAIFPEPHQFRPERFLDNRAYPHAFFPFGFGSRICAGKPFALHQMHLILATFLRQDGLRLSSGYNPRPVRRMVLIVPQGGTVMLKSVRANCGHTPVIKMGEAPELVSG